MKVVLLCIALFTLNACSGLISNVHPTIGWQAVYKHDQNGVPISGSIETLINGIRKGYSVRVGWGWEKDIRGSLVRLEHVAEPVFLSIIQERLVSVVIDPHPLLDSYLNIEQQTIRNSGQIWQCVLTSNGSFNAKVFSRKTGELIKDWPQRHTMTWFLESPLNPSEKSADPLYRAPNLDSHNLN